MKFTINYNHMSLSGRQVVHYNILTAKAATGVGNSIPVRDFRNCVVRIGTASSANLTLKAQGAICQTATDYTAPDFAAARTVANLWDYIQMIDLQNGTPVNGDDGFIVTGTDDFQQFEINVNGLDFINFEVTARSAGSVTVDVQLTTNI